MRTLIVVATLLACAGNAVHAQSKPNDRKGFWIGFGLGGGSLGFDCSYCSEERSPGGSGYLRLGGTISRSFLLGFETNWWVHSQDIIFSDGSTTTLNEATGFGSIVALWYPSATGAFYLKVGLGGMTYAAALDDGSGDELTATAPSISLGAGYEFRVGRNMSLVPYVNTLGTSSVAVHSGGVSVDTDITVNIFELGLGLTWH